MRNAVCFISIVSKTYRDIAFTYWTAEACCILDRRLNRHEQDFEVKLVGTSYSVRRCYHLRGGHAHVYLVIDTDIRGGTASKSTMIDNIIEDLEVGVNGRSVIQREGQSKVSLQMILDL